MNGETIEGKFAIPKVIMSIIRTRITIFSFLSKVKHALAFKSRSDFHFSIRSPGVKGLTGS